MIAELVALGWLHVESLPPVEGATIVFGAAAPDGGVVYEGAVAGVPEDGSHVEEAWLTRVALVEEDVPLVGGTSGVEKWMRWPAATQHMPATKTNAPHARTAGSNGRDFTAFPSPRIGRNNAPIDEMRWKVGRCVHIDPRRFGQDQ